jgi:hypothetical protein
MLNAAVAEGKRISRSVRRRQPERVESVPAAPFNTGMTRLARVIGSPWPAYLLAAAALTAGGPLFLRMPPWVDLTLYDVAANNLLAGGVHYRDVFDTNLPGFVWALTAVRAAFGPAPEVVRAADLLVVGGTVWLLARLAGRAGATRPGRAWLAAGAALFYPFTPEINHCQRDVWMLLPAVAATLLRVRRLTKLDGPPGFGGSLVEGALWGLAVWVKPHALMPAAAVWLATARRGWLADALGYLAGGLLVGAAGVFGLVASGTWPAFVEVFTVWNQGYFGRTWAEVPHRLPLLLVYFPPWTYLHLAALPLAAWHLADADRPRRGLAALYLSWFLQAVLLQRDIPYIHVPETLLMLGVVAVARLPAVPLVAGWFALAPLVLPAPEVPEGWGAVPYRHTGWLTRHPVWDARMRLWADCWEPRPPAESAARMDALGMVYHFHGSIHWTELQEAAGWLARHGCRDGEVLCWDDSPHALYLRLGVRPGFRFQHVHQMRGNDRGARDRVDAERDQALQRVKWVVGDLQYLGVADPAAIGDWTAAGPDKLPPGLSAYYRRNFPFTLPAVFRTGGGRGRYVVYAVPGRAG